jgi:hypothetical protein
MNRNSEIGSEGRVWRRCQLIGAPLRLILQRIQVLQDFSNNQLLFQAYYCLYLLFHLVCDSFEYFIPVSDGVVY